MVSLAVVFFVVVSLVVVFLLVVELDFEVVFEVCVVGLVDVGGGEASNLNKNEYIPFESWTLPYLQLGVKETSSMAMLPMAASPTLASQIILASVSVSMSTLALTHLLRSTPPAPEPLLCQI